MYIYKQHYYGFIYLWYDRKREKYCIGSHMGSLDDGYTSTTGHFPRAYKKRPQDFKRCILYYHQTDDRQSLYDIEHFILQYYVKEYELGIKYYNLKRVGQGFDSGTARKNAYKLLENNNHNSQKPEIVEKTRQKNIERVIKGIHHFLGPEMNKRNLQNGQHVSQQLGFSEKMSLIALERVKNKTHNLQGKDNNNRLYEMNKHPFQQPEFIQKLPEQTRKYQKFLIENGMHISQKEFTCPYCGKIGKGGSMFRWHFDNCKHNPKH